jgi:hypothetical protein
MLEECHISDLKKGDHFLRGRWLYRVERTSKLTCQASRLYMVKGNEVVVRPPKKMKMRDQVMLVGIPEYTEVSESAIKT